MNRPGKLRGATSRQALLRLGERGQLTVEEGRRLLLLSEPEARLQSWAVEVARAHGWLAYHTQNSEHSEAGFYDLFALHPERLVIILAEFKREDGQPTAEQYQWGEAAARLEARWSGYGWVTPPIRFYLWRPSDKAEIERVFA